MKKIYLALVMLMMGTAAFAQRTVRLEVELMTPANGASVPVSTPFDQLFVVTNAGPDVIEPTDTLFFTDPVSRSGAPGYVGILGYSKAVGDTIQFVRPGVSFTASSGGAYNYCVTAEILNRTEPVTQDTVGAPWLDCNAITITGGTGIENILSTKPATQNLAISPNPASGVVNFDFTAKGNAEVIAQVLDITGRVVLTHNYGKSFNGQKGYSLDVTGLMSGMYFVQLQQEGESIRAVGKLNKQ